MPEFKPTLGTEEEALELKDSLLQIHYHAQVQIRNQVNNSEKTYSSVHLEEYLREKREYLKWKTSFPLFRIFREKPNPKLYNPSLPC